MGGKFHVLFDAVRRAMVDTPRSSSLVHGPAEIATRGRLKSPPEAGGNRHPGAVDLLGGWGSPLSLTSK
jgi:hypothetical protein